MEGCKDYAKAGADTGSKGNQGKKEVLKRGGR